MYFNLPIFPIVEIMAEIGGLATPQQGRPRANSQALASLVLKDYDVQRTIGEGGFAKVKLGVVCRPSRCEATGMPRL